MKPLVKPYTILVDAKVEAEMPIWYTRSAEGRAQALERRVREFHSHCRDHRSLDDIVLSVVRVFETRCSGCHAKWEWVFDDDAPGTKICANCGEPSE